MTVVVVGAAENRPGQVSHLTEIIRASLPKYNPLPAAPAQPAPESAANESYPVDGDVVELPKYFVRNRGLSGVEPDKLLSKSVLAAKMRREYRNSLGSLGWALNSFSIPFLTPSVAARAQAKYEDDRRAAELSRLGDLIEVTSRLDPMAAADLKRELKKR